MFAQALETAIILLLAKRKKIPTHTFPPSILLLLLILYLALTLFSSLPSPFLYHLQRQLFPSK